MPQPDPVSDFIHDLRQRTNSDVRDDEYSRLLYSTDASIYQVMPHAVMLPQSVEDVQAAVELAAQYKLPILPRAGGSSLAGQAVNSALVLDTTRHLDQILEVNVAEKWVRVQPGVVLDSLNAALAPHGLQFGPDPASSNRAGMGGIVANNSTGSHSIMYGMTADHVLATSVILSDGSQAHFEALDADALAYKRMQSDLEGTIYRGMAGLIENEAHRATIKRGTPRHWRRCGGYNLDRLYASGVNYHLPVDDRFNLAKLMCGSEGSLGVMTELTLQLVNRPVQTAVAVVGFDTHSDALAAIPAMLEAGPSAIEMLDNTQLAMCRQAPAYERLLRSFLDSDPFCILITEFYGSSTSELNHKITQLEKTLRAHNVPASSVTPLYDQTQQQAVWRVRKGGLGLIMSVRGDHKPLPFIEDAAVPVEHLHAYVTRLEQFCTEIGTKMAYYAHASAGCVHVRPLINAKVASEIAKLPQIINFAVELLGEYGGALSSEHGDGRARSWANEHFFGQPLYNLYRDVKRTFDPDNIMNPGTVVEGPLMTEDLRFGAGYTVIPLKEHLDFSADLGWHRAVEMCNGAGICRKRTSGTMCPSFMATREEEHSTRGRANMLRNVFSGRLPASELTSPRMYEVMDLCISCKACKSECPSSVDMAKIKTEFLAHYYDANGTPLRVRLFGGIAQLNRLSSGPLAPLANWSMGLAPVRYGLGEVLRD